MTTALSFDFLASTLADVLMMDPEELAPDAMLVDDLGVQSIDIVELVEHLEESCGADLQGFDFGEVETVAELHGAFQSALARSRRAA